MTVIFILNGVAPAYQRPSGGEIDVVLQQSLTRRRTLSVSLSDQSAHSSSSSPLLSSLSMNSVLASVGAAGSAAVFTVTFM